MDKEKFNNIRSMFENGPKVNLRKDLIKTRVSKSFECLDIKDSDEELEEANNFDDQSFSEEEETLEEQPSNEDEKPEEEFYDFTSTEKYLQPEVEEINEVIKTEESFVKVLDILYKNYFLYLIELSNAESLTNGLKVVKQLLHGHGKFLTELKKNPFLDQISDIIQQNRFIFEVYPNYCTLYDDLIHHMKTFAFETQEIQSKLEDSDDICAYLRKLLTQYTSYPLHFKAILKLISGKNLPDEALKMHNHIKFIEEILGKGNTIMACKNLENCPVTPEELGIYHLSDTFLVSVKNDSWGTLRVMCFNNYLLFTKQVPGDKESYKMEFFIPMTDLYKVNGNDPKKLTICKFSEKTLNKYTVLENDDKNTIEMWTKKIEEILLNQLIAARDHKM